MITHCSPAVGEDCTSVSIQDLIGTNLLFDADFQSFRQQLLLRSCSRLEVMITGTPLFRDQIEESVPDGLYAVEPDNDTAGWTLREIDAVCRRHVAASLSATANQQYAGFSTYKVGGARGKLLQNGFCVLPNNVAFELVPQALLCEIRMNIQTFRAFCFDCMKSHTSGIPTATNQNLQTA